MTTTSAARAALPRPLAAALLPAAAALAAMILTAPAAHALTEQQIKDECKAANGTYSTNVDTDGTRYSMCCYKDIKGKQYCDAYVNGNYYGTSPSGGEPGTPTATVHPVQPPPGTAPVAPGAPPAGPQPVQPPPATERPIIP
jgi:hypothetical protein